MPTAEACPFCGQGIDGLPLIAAYRAIFSDRYQALRNDIASMRDEIADQFGEGALGRISTLVEQNKGASEFWGRYCAFDAQAIAFPNEISEAMRALGQAALAPLDRKARAPLEPIRPDEKFSEALASYEAAQAKAQEIAGAVRAMNALIAKKKEETGAADVKAAEAELARLNGIKVRHSDPVAGLCAEHASLTTAKAEVDERKAKARAQLDEHSRNVMQPYERRINHYLDAFNAGFRIAETRHGYPGGTAASSYQLVINDTAIDIGDGRTPPDRPSFKNTLSAGDRTTLGTGVLPCSPRTG